ncbi:MAG: YciK family oxidoreductase [Pseudomonadota bacterium]
MQDFTPTPDLLKNKAILVTGAGDGIGRTAALTFAHYGATVILLGRTTKKLESIYDEIEQNGYPQPAIYPMNLEGAAPKDYQDLANIIEQEFGHLDGLLNNAAILGKLAPVQHYDIETWFKVMQVNLNAQFMLTQACLPLLGKAEYGRIVFTSSGVSQAPRAYWGAYSVSKAGIDNFMGTLADELENTKVTTNSINPGATRTAMRQIAYPAEEPESLKTPASIMNTYLYLMSEASTEVNGQVITAIEEQLAPA